MTAVVMQRSMDEESAFISTIPGIRSNAGTLVPSSSSGWMKSVESTLPYEFMRAHYEADGYLWVKNVIPRDVVLDMREHYFRMLSLTGILLPGSSPRDGIFDSSEDPLVHQGIGALPELETLELLDKAHASQFYREFLAHPALRTFVRGFMDWKNEVLVDRAMLRHNCPGSQSTGIHYDKLFLRAGEADFLTAWVPIGDCTANGGGLMYLENSCRLGEEIEIAFNQKAQVLSREERIDAFNPNMKRGGFLSHDAEEFSRVEAQGKLRWLVGNFEAGDVVFHKPFMVHAATRNEDAAGRIRLASDLRFYEEGAALDKRWLRVWTHDDGL